MRSPWANGERHDTTALTIYEEPNRSLWIMASARVSESWHLGRNRGSTASWAITSPRSILEDHHYGVG